MMMVLADGKHFRAGVRRRKRVAVFFLDDASRFGLGVVVGTDETAELFLRGLHGVLRRFGFMDVVFLDYVPRNIIEVLWPIALCGHPRPFSSRNADGVGGSEHIT